MKETAQKFYHIAAKFCGFIDSLDKYGDETRYNKLLENLLILYMSGFYLPQVDSVSKNETVDIPCPKVNMKKYDGYWEVFNPYHQEEPIQGSLTDDISGIYQDLQSGIYLYEQKNFQDAIWTWKFGFEIHWGAHLLMRYMLCIPLYTENFTCNKRRSVLFSCGSREFLSGW